MTESVDKSALNLNNESPEIVVEANSKCELNQQKKESDQNVKQNQLEINTLRIRELTQQIRNVTDCNALRIIVKQHLDEVKDLANEALKEQARLLKNVLPILKLPGPNPFAIIKWLGKLVTGTALPQLEAYIKYASQIVKLLIAINDMVDAISQVLPRLEQCAKLLVTEIKADIVGEIDRAVFKLKGEIANEIAQEICFALNDANISATDIQDAFLVINTIKNVVEQTATVQSDLTASVNESLLDIDNAQNQIAVITGQTSRIDTSSIENFTASIDRGDFETFKSDSDSFLNVEPPVNTSIPVITGFTKVANTLFASSGDWTSSANITFSYQWSRSSNNVVNTLSTAVSNTYLITSSDLGSKLLCVVGADNGGGYSEISTVETAIITL